MAHILGPACHTRRHNVAGGQPKMDAIKQVGERKDSKWRMHTNTHTLTLICLLYPACDRVAALLLN